MDFATLPCSSVYKKRGTEREKDMLCLKPLIRVNEDSSLYLALKKSWYSYKHFPNKDKLQYYKTNGWVDIFPCGQCIPCRNMARYRWVKRMEYEKKLWTYTYFITITYRDNPVTLVKKDIQNFIKYYRKFDSEFKYFLCGEYGSKSSRPHYHVILFTNNKLDLFYLKTTPSGALYRAPLLEKCWLNKGHIFVAHDIDCASFSYVCSYSNKAFAKWKTNYNISMLTKLNENFLNLWYTNNVVKNNMDFTNITNRCNILREVRDIYKRISAHTDIIKSYREQVPEFIFMSKRVPIGSNCTNFRECPSTMLKWFKKHNWVCEDDMSKVDLELKKRKDDFDTFLNYNDIYQIVETNRLLVPRKIKDKGNI